MGQNKPITAGIIKVRFFGVIQCPRQTLVMLNVNEMPHEKLQFEHGESYFHSGEYLLLQKVVCLCWFVWDDFVIFRVHRFGYHVGIVVIV